MNAIARISLGIVDLFFRLRNKTRRQILGKKVFSTTTHASDSEDLFYLNVVRRSLTNPKSFSNFRRNFDYREILEHVSYSLGNRYLALGQERYPDFLDILTKSRNIDEVGNPVKFKFMNLGLCSPTRIRYAYVAAEMRNIFNFESIHKIAEIGTGYGGQSAVLQYLKKFSNYIIYDLPEVAELTQRFLVQTNSTFVSTIGNWESSNEIHSDLVISNYAFSELPRSIQEVYLKNVIAKASRGYMIMNSGRTNHTGRSTGKMSLDEISTYLPQMRILEEDPLTSPDNYIIVWDSTKLAIESA